MSVFKSQLIPEIIRQEQILEDVKILFNKISLELLIVKSVIDKYNVATCKMIFDSDLELLTNFRSDIRIVYDQFLQKIAGLDTATTISRWMKRLFSYENGGFNMRGYCMKFDNTFAGYNNWVIKKGHYEIIYPSHAEALSMLILGINWKIDLNVSMSHYDDYCAYHKIDLCTCFNF